MIRVLASVDSEEDGMLLKRKLQSRLDMEQDPLQLTLTHPFGLKSTWDSQTAVALICGNQFRTVHRLGLKGLRNSGFTGPILVVTKLEAEKLRQELNQEEKVFLLEKPYDPRDLLGLVDKFILDLQVQNRIHRRFATSAEAQVELANGHKLDSLMLNLSRGGAYFEAKAQVHLVRGQTLLLNISLAEMQKSYRLPAKVVWLSHGGSSSTSIGVEFIGKGEVKELAAA